MTDGRERLQVKAALMRDVGVAVERDVGQRVLIIHQKVASIEALLQHFQRRHPVGVPLLAAFAQLRLTLALLKHPEAAHGDVRLQRVLLETHVLHHARARDGAGR